MSRWIAVLLASVLVAFALPSLAAAQNAEPKRSPLGIAVPSEDTGGPSITGGRPAQPMRPASSPSALDRGWFWVLEQQRRLRTELNQAVISIKRDPFGPGFLLIVFVGFAYGVLHAVGPGHGKGVITSYVLADHQAVRRGVLLCFLSAGIQALVAIAIFGVLNGLFSATKQEFDAVERWLATLSWGLVALFGAWLLYRQVRPLLAAAAPALAVGHAHGHGHGHGAHHHDHHHGPDHTHGADCGCGHAHVPAPRDLAGPWSWRRALAIAFAVGIRPCTGALGILALTTTSGLFWVGASAAAAMGLGTAITTSALVALAAGSRDLAMRFGGGGPWAERIATAAGLTGATALLLLGTVLFLASLHGGGIGPI